MKRKLLLTLLALLPMFASAYDAEIDGIYYDFSGNEAEVVKNWEKEYSGDVIIPESITYDDKTYSVTSISSLAFNCCRSLISVTIPNSMTSIGDDTFSGCRNLISVTIPNSVTSIGICAFQYCYSLTSVNIPNNVTSIGRHAFDSCRSLTSITIPNKVTRIEDESFYNCI